MSGVKVTQPRPRMCCVGLRLFLGFSFVFLVVLCFAVLASKGILSSSRLSVRHASEAIACRLSEVKCQSINLAPFVMGCLVGNDVNYRCFENSGSF